MMKTLFDKRRDALRQLSVERGGPTRLARDLGYTNGTYLSQLIGQNPSRTVGERLARSIEEKLELAEGFLDGTPAEPPGLNDDKLEASLRAVSIAAAELGQRLTAPQQAKLVALVYSQALGSTMPDGAYIKRLMKLLKP